MEDHLTHLDKHGAARMVDVGDKPDSTRTAVAEGFVYMKPETLSLIRAGNIKKGDVLTIARIAGIMGAKRTADLIPLCHPLPLSLIDVETTLDDKRNAARILATAKTTGKTGVEMEALTAVNIAALTIYDMAKAVDRSMRIGDVRLLEKRGGIHGDYVAEAAANEG
jgi:cyclic pyranopterin phosphate synthase